MRFCSCRWLVECPGDKLLAVVNCSSACVMNTDLRSFIRSFRVAELQLCLQELGLSRKGLKADLQARLFAYFGAANSVAAGGVNPPREQHRLDSAGRTRSLSSLDMCQSVHRCVSALVSCVALALRLTASMLVQRD